MDPLTHTLFGANLAATRLGEKTRLAAAALVVGANLPDVDAVLYFTGHQDLALECRRGWTHGVLALLLLPLIQTALLLLYDRARPDPSRRADPKWLLLLSYGAILSHPSLDWLNNYGMRWLMPFDGRWFYGDALFIMDPWLWLMLGIGWVSGRRASRTTVALFVLALLPLLWIVWQRAAGYVPVVLLVAALLFTAMLWRPSPEAARNVTFAALLASTLYIGARLFLNEATERKVVDAIGPVEKVMASPTPLNPFVWDIVVQTETVYRHGRYEWGRGLSMNDTALPRPADTEEWRRAQKDPGVRGFINWARFPWYEVERQNGRTIVHIYDARYMTLGRGRGFGGATVVLE